MSVLVIAEHDGLRLKSATFHAVTAACELPGEDVVVLVAGTACQQVAEQAASIVGIDRVLLAEADVFADQLAESLAPLIVQCSKERQYIVATATTFGKDLLPRVAALLDVPQLSAVTQIVDGQTFVRPIYAGNALATVSVAVPQLVLTVQATAFSAAEVGEVLAPIEAIDSEVDNQKSRLLSQSLTQSERPELTAARVVVSGGRGLGSQENFALVEALADVLSAAVGASRAAVDAGFVPNDYQVGQTGKIVAPELYIAIGISGAIQHLAGMTESRVIVAINKDEEAPIFQVADYGLVGDLFSIVPALTAALAS